MGLRLLLGVRAAFFIVALFLVSACSVEQSFQSAPELMRLRLQTGAIGSFNAKSQSVISSGGASAQFQSYQVFSPTGNSSEDGGSGSNLYTRKFYEIAINAITDEVASDNALLLANAGDAIVANQGVLFEGNSIPALEIIKVSTAEQGQLAKVLFRQMRQLYVPDAGLTINLAIENTEFNFVYTPVSSSQGADQQLKLINQVYEDSGPFVANAANLLPFSTITNQIINGTYFLETYTPIPGSRPDTGAQPTTMSLVPVTVSGAAQVTIGEACFLNEQLVWQASVLGVRQDGSNRPELLEVYVNALSGLIVDYRPAAMHAYEGTGYTDFYYSDPTSGSVRYGYPLRDLDATGFVRGRYAEMRSLGGPIQFPDLNFREAINPFTGLIQNFDVYFEAFNYFQASQAKNVVDLLGFGGLLNNSIIVREDNFLPSSFLSNQNPSLRQISLTTDDSQDTFMLHEISHALQNDISPTMIFQMNHELRSIGEGTADYLVGAIHDEPQLFKHVGNIFSIPFIRTINNSIIAADNNPHTNGLRIAALLWDLRNRYGNATAARVMLRALELTGLSDDFRSFVQINMVQAANSLFIPEVAAAVALLGKHGRDLDPFTPLQSNPQPWDILETEHPYDDQLAFLQSYNIPGAPEIFVTIGADSKSVINSIFPPLGDTFEMYDQNGIDHFAGITFLEEARGRCFQLPGEAVIVSAAGPVDQWQATGLYVEDVSVGIPGNQGPSATVTPLVQSSNYEALRIRFDLHAMHQEASGRITSAKLTTNHTDHPMFFDLSGVAPGGSTVDSWIEILVTRAGLPPQDYMLEWDVTVTDNNCVEQRINGLVDLSITLGGANYAGDATL